jgi:hypothetical protein
VSIAPQTLLAYSGGYGINAEAAYSKLLSQGQTIGNSAGQIASTVTQANLSGGNVTAAGTVAGIAGRFTDASNTTQTLQVINTGSNGANITLVGNGATTPNKSIRVSNGNLQVVNSAYSATPFSLTDAGALTVTGPVNGQGGIQSNGVTINPVLSGTTGSIGGSALAAGACTSGTVSVTNSTTSMAVIATPATYPGDGIFWHGYVSAAGTVTVKVCATVAATPTASAYNVRVLQ